MTELDEISPWYPAVEDRSCVKLTRDGREFEEIYCVYPWLKKYYMNWELSWRPMWLYDFIMNNPWFPMACVVLYLIGIMVGPKFMEKRKPYVMRKTLALWNLSLAVLSVFGLIRGIPPLLHNFSTYGIESFLCNDPQNSIGQSATAVWGIFFVLSKPAELIDTFFIVAHKKPLLLLHWYHHVTVLLCCWHSYVYHNPAGLIYSTINYGVHAIMYFYYFLMAIKMKPSWFDPKWITLAQITQMVAGCLVSMASFNGMRKPGCWAKMENNASILIMYVSYFILFVQFFLNRYGFGVKMDFLTKTTTKRTSSSSSSRTTQTTTPTTTNTNSQAKIKMV